MKRWYQLFIYTDLVCSSTFKRVQILVKHFLFFVLIFYFCLFVVHSKRLNQHSIKIKKNTEHDDIEPSQIKTGVRIRHISPGGSRSIGYGSTWICDKILNKKWIHFQQCFWPEESVIKEIYCQSKDKIFLQFDRSESLDENIYYNFFLSLLQLKIV